MGVSKMLSLSLVATAYVSEISLYVLGLARSCHAKVVREIHICLGGTNLTGIEQILTADNTFLVVHNMIELVSFRRSL